MNTSEEFFTAAIEELTGESPYSVIAFARTLNDPWAYLDSVREDARAENIHENFPEEYEEFNERIEEFLDTVDASLVSPERIAKDTDKWYSEPELESYYSPRQFRQDVWGKGSPVWVVDSSTSHLGGRLGNTSRDIWKRATKDQSKDIRILCDYGNFSLEITNNLHKAFYKVRTSVRKGIPVLGIGPVEVNMNTGQVACRVSGCNHRGQLTYSADSEVEADREWMEYQVLRILAHIGWHNNRFPKTHTKDGRSTHFPKILETKRHRDSDDEKVPFQVNVGV